MIIVITITMILIIVLVVILLFIFFIGGLADVVLEVRVGIMLVLLLEFVCNGGVVEGAIGDFVVLIWIDDFVVWFISECEVCLLVEMDGVVGGVFEVFFVSVVFSVVDCGVGVGVIKIKCCRYRWFYRYFLLLVYFKKWYCWFNFVMLFFLMSIWNVRNF